MYLYLEYQPQAMLNLHGVDTRIEEDGFAIIEGVFTATEVAAIIDIVSKADGSNATFRRKGDLYAIRRFFKELPGIVPVVFTENLKNIITTIFGDGYFVVKSIYFDKPGLSNWFVAYHQDLTISVDSNQPVKGFANFTVKQGQYAVQPPAEILQGNFTIRMHLDDTDECNGALKVIAGSHKNGIINHGSVNFSPEKETVCAVKSGGIMIMKPLLLHASAKTVNNKRRRVVHIEFSKTGLPGSLQWSEEDAIKW